MRFHMSETTRTAAQAEAEREEQERRMKAAADFKIGQEIAAKLPQPMRRGDD